VIPENITKEHLLKAINEIDRDGIRPNRHSSTYDVLYNNNLYPPKLIVSIANKFANGEELDHNSFWGGHGKPAFTLLEKHGFEIMKKEQNGTTQPKVWIEKTLIKGRKDREEGKRALGKALWSPQADKRGADVYKNMKRVKKGDIVLHLINNYSFDSVSIVENEAIKTSGISGTDWEGPAFLIQLKRNIQLEELFTKEYILNNRNKQNLTDISESSEVFYTKKMTLRQGAYLTPCALELLSIINEEYKKFSGHDLPIHNLIKLVKPIKENQTLFSVTSFLRDLKYSNLLLSKKLVSSFVASLTTKPFVLLSGLSGSGKTKLAEAFVKWTCANEEQYKLVPVGADWTNREPLLGFPNALSKGEYTHPDNGVLKLIIEANKNADQPYFLILDEMNLSHVERYFADFLSTMESSDAEIQLHDSDAIADETKDDFVPKTIKLPKNLFIIGTVNIDETTYMFSPKVLDRANTIEFRVTKDEIDGFFKDPKDIDLDVLKTKGATMATSFLEMSIAESGKPTELVQKELVSFFVDLQKTGTEFGYRTANEMVKLITNLKELGMDDENECIDVAIMQKMLPKLNGSRRKLSKVLISLGQKCLVDKTQDIESIIFNNQDYKFPTKEEKEEDRYVETIKYHLSLEKITRMYRNARDNGFASYAEA
jgi:5-methylcytosine-specific restriction protein B